MCAKWHWLAARDLSVGGAAGGAGVFPGYGSVAGIGGPGAVPGAGGAVYVDLSQFLTT